MEKCGGDRRTGRRVGMLEMLKPPPSLLSVKVLLGEFERERESQVALDLALCFAFCVFVCKMVRESFLRVVVLVAGW